MEAYEFRAWEVCGYWTMVVVRITDDDCGPVKRELMYRGDHVPIDEEDPQLRLTLLLCQVAEDLNWSLQQLAAVVDDS